MHGMLAVFMLASSSLLVPAAAHADLVDNGSDGVTVTVEIAPRACVTNCAGGGTSGPGTAGGLPATGVDFSMAFVWIAVALVAFGLILVLRRRRNRASAVSLRILSTPTMAGGVITSHARPSQPRRTQAGGSREADGPEIE